MADTVTELAELEKELKELGISSEMAEQLQRIMERYVAAKEQMVAKRDTQFSEDAYDVLVSLKAATNKNIDLMAGFLRRFAEHVALHVGRMEKTIGGVEDMIDRVPPMKQENHEA